ncbi:hypothetical protein AM593_03728, partial [Mytilus galloprovincialis]
MILTGDLVIGGIVGVAKFDISISARLSLPFGANARRPDRGSLNLHFDNENFDDGTQCYAETTYSNEHTKCSLLGDLLEMSMKQKSPDKGCQCLSRTTIPAFQSMLTQPQTPGDKGVIKFDKVVTNIRNGYNPTT